MGPTAAVPRFNESLELCQAPLQERERDAKFLGFLLRDAKVLHEMLREKPGIEISVEHARPQVGECP